MGEDHVFIEFCLIINCICYLKCKLKIIDNSVFIFIIYDCLKNIQMIFCYFNRESQCTDRSHTEKYQFSPPKIKLIKIVLDLVHFM